MFTANCFLDMIKKLAKMQRKGSDGFHGIVSAYPIYSLSLESQAAREF